MRGMLDVRLAEVAWEQCQTSAWQLHQQSCMSRHEINMVACAPQDCEHRGRFQDRQQAVRGVA